MVKQSLWSLKSHKNTILKIFIKLSGSAFVLLLCMKPDLFKMEMIFHMIV